MTALNSLTKKRRGFLNQIYNIVDNQFKKQEEDFNGKEPKDIIKELENNSEYIQRIFIDGSWGTGKSYFCEALEEKINEENEKREKERKINFIKINAWETDYFSDPMKSIIGELNTHKLLNSETQRVIEKIMENIFKAGGKFLLNFFLKKFQISADDWEDLKAILNGVSTSELKDYKNYKELVDKFKECLSLEKDLKVIVIDELDRCKPTYAIELLETVKHFFGVKNIIFIFLVNMEQLRSIASTSYLTEDKCSEYFEKFYDIKFTLPSLDYNDFLQIEYDKYNQLATYKPSVKDFKNISNESGRFYESLFLEAFNSNCDGESVAPRNFIKSFKKFSLLLSSLSEEEKSCYPLMIILVLYFIREEFSLKYKKKQENEDNKLPILLLYLRTFFEKKDLTQFENILEDYEFTTSLNEDIRRKVQFNNYNFYKKLYLILFHKTGVLRKDSFGDDIISEFLTLENSYDEEYKENVNYLLSSDEIVFNNVEYVCSEKGYSGNCLVLPLSLFQEINKNPHKTGTYSSIYNTNILEAWAKEKYSFVLNI